VAMMAESDNPNEAVVAPSATPASIPVSAQRVMSSTGSKAMPIPAEPSHFTATAPPGRRVDHHLNHLKKGVILFTCVHIQHWILEM
jgi:hypothetical protein